MRKMTSSILIALVATALAASVAPADDTSKFFTAADYFDFEYVSDPQISPDGERIVYVRNFMDVMTDKSYSNLWIVDFDGTDNRPLTSGLFSDAQPRWSPDGKTLIFTSDRTGTPQIHKRWMDTGHTVALTNLLFPAMGITWSPDGTQIAFSAPVPSAPPTVTEMPPAPPGATWAQPATVIDRMIYRFDGIGYTIGQGYMHVFVMPAEGGTPRQISKGDFHHPFPMLGGGIEWTRDGKFLLASANRTEEVELDMFNTEIYRFSVADGEMTALTSRRGPDGSPKLSPDGKTIAYLGYDDRFLSHQVSKIHLMDLEGGPSKVILGDLDRPISGIQWAKDGRGLFFLTDDKGHTWLAHTTLDGKVKRLTGNIGAGVTAYGGGGSYTISGNGRFALTYSTPDHPSDIGLGSVSQPELRVVTAVNDDILGHKTLGAVEEIWWKSSYDGRDVQGWIIKPPDFDPSKKYPLILEIHGGPIANYGDRFDIEKQLLASAGYVVLYANPRGSTSYGEDFGNLIHRKYPGNDFDDLDSGVDAVLAKGYIDEDNLFVTGGSAGGIMTCWMIGKTDRFRAAATLYPVVNWYSTALTSDIPFLAVKYEFPGFPWDHTEEYMKFSPISLVGNVTTPTAVICGEEDWRCPIVESEQYYMALKMLGIETVLIRFPGASHGIRNRPSMHLSKMLHIISWFEKYRTE